MLWLRRWPIEDTARRAVCTMTLDSRILSYRRYQLPPTSSRPLRALRGAHLEDRTITPFMFPIRFRTRLLLRLNRRPGMQSMRLRHDCRFRIADCGLNNEVGLSVSSCSLSPSGIRAFNQEELS